MAKETVNWETTQSRARTQSTLTTHIHLTPNSHFVIWVQGCISISTYRKELLAFQSSSSCLYSISGNPQPLLIKQPGACMLRLWWYEFMPWCLHISEPPPLPANCLINWSTSLILPLSKLIRSLPPLLPLILLFPVLSLPLSLLYCLLVLRKRPTLQQMGEEHHKSFTWVDKLRSYV